jgi:hypothetical protein
VNQRINKAMVVIAATVIAAGVAACGDDDTDEAAIDRYCDAVAAAEQRGEELFADIDEDDEDARLAAERAMLEFVRSTFPAGDELPDEIQDDFEAFLAGMEGNVEPDSDPTEQQQAAEQRLLDWEQEHCSSQ